MTDQAVRPRADAWTWAFFLFLVAAFGLIVLELRGSGGHGFQWFQLGAARDGLKAVHVLKGFATSALVLSALTILLAAITSVPNWPLSGGQANAYLAALRIMAAFAALLSAACALHLGGLGAWLSLLVFAALVTAACLLLWGMARLVPDRFNAIRAPLFDFYQVYVLKPLEEDQVRTVEVFSEFMHRPDARPVIVISFAAPVMLGLAGIAAISALAVFGFGAFAEIWMLVPSLALMQVTERGKSLADYARQLNIGPWHLSALAGLIALVILRRVRRMFLSDGHPLLIHFGMRALAIVQVFAALSAVIFLLLFAKPKTGGIMQGGSYALLVLLVVSGVSAYMLHAGERVVRRSIAGRHALRTRKFWIDTWRILSFFPQPEDPKGHVVLATQNCTYTIASTLLVLCRLKQMGWALVVMDEWPVRPERTGNGQIDRFFRAKIGYQTALNFDWTIDWKNKRVEAAGMNFYHPIWEGISRHFGRYTVDIPEGSEAEQVFKSILQVTDSALLWAFRLNNTLAGYGKPVRIVGASAQFVPNAVWNIFCREIGYKRDMHFIWVQQGYQTYYADKAKLSKRITLDNMTRKWPYSNPYLPAKGDFEAWVARGQDVKAITERAVAWTKANRATEVARMIQPAREAFERITSHRASGKPVVCVLGKMVFDLSTPYERGPAHEGMFDWINHTVEIAAKNPDVLYIIKPHPYEARPDIAGRVEQYFTDMIEQSIPPNVLILAHNWFNLHALFPHIDLGVLWNGTSGLELGLHGIPCIICSDWGPIDYPVGLAHPKDRADYERMMSNPKSVAMPADFTEKCALLLEYTASDELMFHYDYAARPITNEPFGPPYWYWDQVLRFIREGDPNIDAAARRFL